VIGVDVARGLALLGMIAVHIFDTLHGNNTPSKTQQVMPVMPWRPSCSLPASASPSSPSAAAPAPCIQTPQHSRGSDHHVELIELALNSALDPDIEVILPYYGLMFLLAIPLLRRSSPVLIGISMGLVLLAPLVVLASFNTNLPDNEPTLAALIHPVELFK
jgi:hypothetical protein